MEIDSQNYSKLILILRPFSFNLFLLYIFLIMIYIYSLINYIK